MKLHLLHRMWQALPAGARRAAFARVASALAPVPGHPAPPVSGGGVIVAGEIDRASGLGEGARLMAAGLERLGIPVRTIRAGLLVPGEQVSARQDLASLPAGWPIVLHVNSPVLPAALLRLPRSLIRGRRVIGYWAWELPVVPAAWQTGVRFVHEVWTPSRFSAGAIEPLAPGRVRVVNHPVAARPPVPSGLSRSDFGLPDDAVVVLVSFSLASSFERKNPLGAISAFVQAFGDRPDRVLVLKIVHSHHAPHDLALLRAATGGAANILFETRTLPAPDSHALTACCDIVLSLHRSEGFGLVPAEAMLLGKPVVATDFSGTTDFLDATCGIPVGFTLIPAVDERGVFEAPGAMWADADIREAADALRHLAADPAERARIGEAARLAGQARLGAASLQAGLLSLGFDPAQFDRISGTTGRGET